MTYHAKSWSRQAREICDGQIMNIEDGWQTINGAIKFFSESYRADIIRYRAAKRFGRMVRAGKVHENPELFSQHFPNELSFQHFSKYMMF